MNSLISFGLNSPLLAAELDYRACHGVNTDFLNNYIIVNFLTKKLKKN